MGHRFRSLHVGLLLGILAATASADVFYKVTPDPDKQKLNVEISFARTKFDSDLQMPNWAPGSYRLEKSFLSVSDFKATDGTGMEIPFTKPNDYTWRISSASVPQLHVSYKVPCGLEDGAMHYSGPSTYMYLVDRETEPCTVTLVLPPAWQLAVGMESSKKDPHTFSVKTYDVLADNPVTMGSFIERHYLSHGKDTTISVRGSVKNDVDLPRLEKACQFVSDMEADFFGVSPYDKYVWHFQTFDRPDGGWGLEHLSSTEIGLSPSIGPRVFTVISHEHFHLWNVKRIRSSVLGPFDYTKLPQTGALWWLEGVTDYYSHFLLHRYGWWTDKDLYTDIAKNVTSVRSNSHRMEISPYDSSYRVREADNNLGNSQGLMVSYYDTGWLLGMMLDIEIRAQTGGKKSLDDVTMALWKECRNDQPGFPEDGIRKELVAFGGPALGTDYDKWVMQSGELPVEDELAKVGLRLVEQQRTEPSLGFLWWSGREFGGAKVHRVTDDKSPLKLNDVITDIDGKSLGNRSAAQIEQIVGVAVKQSNPGTPVHVKVMRDGKPMEFDLDPSMQPSTVKVVEEVPGAPADQVRLRDGWFWGQHKRPTEIVGP